MTIFAENIPAVGTLMRVIRSFPNFFYEKQGKGKNERTTDPRLQPVAVPDGTLGQMRRAYKFFFWPLASRM